MRLYRSLFERLVANTAEPENAQSCWLWTGVTNTGGYPVLSIRYPDRPSPIGRRAHRLMLEEILDAEFPFDEGGHLCYVQRCINPDHLEVQTSAANLAERRGYAAPEGGGNPIPTLFPRADLLADAAEAAWDSRGACTDLACPF